MTGYPGVPASGIPTTVPSGGMFSPQAASQINASSQAAQAALTSGTGGGGAPMSYSTPPGLAYGQLTSNFTPQDFLQNLDPGYGFQLAQGQQATRNADTPGVGSLSSSALKDLTTFNQNMAATGYQNAYNRWQTTNSNIFSRLSGIAGLGQNAASNVGTSGTSLGTGVAQAQAAAAGSIAAGQVGTANAIGNNAVPLAYVLSQQNAGAAGQTVSGAGNNLTGD
jgi:hypothetical protein